MVAPSMFFDDVVYAAEHYKKFPLLPTEILGVGSVHVRLLVLERVIRRLVYDPVVSIVTL